MKSNLFTMLLFFSIYVFSQDVAISPEFFTTENMRLSVDVGADVSWAKEGKTGLINSLGTINNESIGYSEKPNTSFNIGFDVYSPQSVLGFYIAANLNKQEYAIHNSTNNQLLDSITNTNIEIPLYLKLRLGKVNRNGHLWMAFGGGYSIATKSTRNTYLGGSKIYESDEKELFNSTPFFSSIIGYEFLIPFSGSKGKEMHNRDNLRILLFAKGNYDLKNRINSDFNFQNNTSLGQIINPELKFVRISFGIKILMRISKLGEMINETIQKRSKY